MITSTERAAAFEAVKAKLGEILPEMLTGYIKDNEIDEIVTVAVEASKRATKLELSARKKALAD